MLPTPEYDVLNLPNKKRIGQYLHSFSDASFGPYRFNKRRGISGGDILCEGGVVRTFAKQQQALSLSSCEAELYALPTPESRKCFIWEVRSSHALLLG